MSAVLSTLGGGYLLSHFRSTIGVVRLNFSVRNGKRWDPHAITTLVSFFSPTAFLASVILMKSSQGTLLGIPVLEYTQAFREPELSVLLTPCLEALFVLVFARFRAKKAFG